MHENADSYHIFVALCSHLLYKRALLQEDLIRFLLYLPAIFELNFPQKVGYYLAQRHSCTLPPDYFAKKAVKAEAVKNMHQEKKI